MLAISIHLTLLSLIVGAAAYATRTRAVFYIVMVAFFVRLALAMFLPSAGDEQVYHRLSMLFLHRLDDWGWLPTLRDPLYKGNYFYMIGAAIYALYGPDLFLIRAFVAAVGALNIILVWRLASIVLQNPRHATLTAALAAFFPDMIHFASIGIRDTLLLGLVLSFLLLSHLLFEARPRRGVAGQVAAIGITFFLRPAQAALLIMLKIVVAIRARVYWALAVVLLIFVLASAYTYRTRGMHLPEAIYTQYFSEWYEFVARPHWEWKEYRDREEMRTHPDRYTHDKVTGLPPVIRHAASLSITLVRPSPFGMFIQFSHIRAINAIKGLAWYVILPLWILGLYRLYKLDHALTWPLVILAVVYVLWAILPGSLLRDPTRIRLQALPVYLIMAVMGWRWAIESVRARGFVYAVYGFLGLLSVAYIIVKATL